MPVSGTGIRTVSPASTRAVSGRGTGAALVATSASRTETVRVAVAHWPSGATAR